MVKPADPWLAGKRGEFGPPTPKSPRDETTGDWLWRGDLLEPMKTGGSCMEMDLLAGAR